MYQGSQNTNIPQLSLFENNVVLVDGSNPLTADWDAGSFEIRAETFQSDVTTGTAPFIVASTTLVSNLNADLLDGQEGSYYTNAGNLASGTVAHERGGLEADVSAFDGYIIISGGATTNIKLNHAATTAPTATDDSASGYAVGSRWIDTTNDKEYVCLDSTASAAVWTETTGVATGAVLADGSVPLTADWDAGAFEIRAQTFQSDVTTGTAPLIVASTTRVDNLNVQYLNGNPSSAFATASHSHAASDITSGTLAHERGGLEANVSAYSGFAWIVSGSTLEFRVNLLASAAPTTGDDELDNYRPGSIWMDNTNGVGYVCIDPSSGAAVWERITDESNQTCQGRLTTESGVPLSTSDRTSQSTIYFTPYKGNRVALYNGTVWKVHSFTERSLALSSLTSGKNYDVFLYDNSGTLTLELTAWTNDTTRATAITLQDGVYVRSGATTRRYLGTIRTTGTTTTEDSDSKRFVWNYYNQVARRVNQDAAGSSTTYATSGTYRAAGGDSNVRCYVVAGLAGYPINLIGHSNFTCASDQAANTCVGEDSTTTASTTEFIECRNHNNSGTNNILMITGGTADVPLGYHYYQLLEKQDVATTTSWLTGQLKGDWLC